MSILQKETDVAVIGSGPAGYVCAIRLAQLGKKVIVIDQGSVGGVCFNVGCIPSKALISAGNLFEKMSQASEMGLEIKEAKLNLPKLQAWKESIVKKLTSGVSSLLKANGCEWLTGTARFTGSHLLEVKNKTETFSIKFQTCVIATGSRPAHLPGTQLEGEKILDSTRALSLKHLPKNLLCIGGGYIGLELGTFYSKIGSQVTVVEASPSLLTGIDPELAQVVSRGLEKRGVEILLNTFVQECKTNSKGVWVSFSTKGNGKIKSRIFDAVLISVGRVPNTDQLSLEKAGLKTDTKGFIAVDAQRRTLVPHLFAIGDVAGEPLLAHKGSKEGLVAAEAISGQKVAYDVCAMPAVIFTDPEIATVGLTESEARSQGFEVRTGTFPFAANGRALSMGESSGFVKVIGDSKSGRLLGVHCVGPEASNLISEAALALEMGASVEDLSLTVHPHPTLSESLMEAAEVTLGHAIHLFQKKAASSPSQLTLN
jgi:dihydrolipoamide dehydrogenase